MASKPSSDKRAANHGGGFRETVENVVVLIIAFFLYRMFEAENFVIPTGSMAPTLHGLHKDLHCEKCGFPYRVNAAEEVDENGRRHVHANSNEPAVWVESCVCPLCRYRMDIGSPAAQARHPSYHGDRILVGKFPYQIGGPKRWDVVVFKYPEEAYVNFIKRMVGLPNETVRILHGDIYVAPAGESVEGKFAIQRKPPEKMQAMLQIVYDNDYLVSSMTEAGWPTRWQAWPVPLDALLAQGWQGSQPFAQPDQALPPGHWTTTDGGKTFSIDGTAAGESWIRYQHTVPDDGDWSDLIDRRKPQARPALIEDFNAYNRGRYNFARNPLFENDSYWVGDLVVSCELQVQSDSGEAVLELVEGGVRFQCRFDLATGQSRLSHSASPEFSGVAQTQVNGPGTYRVAFANLDDELRVWVDGTLLQFEGDATYDSHALRSTTPKDADYAPAGIAARGAQLHVNHLVIHRDIYYIAFDLDTPRETGKGLDFKLGPDQFFVLGDNSARSKDSRLWGTFHAPLHYVDRNLLIGKALFLYWPHSWNKISGTNVPAPYFPNFDRMGPVR